MEIWINERILCYLEAELTKESFVD